MSFTVETPKTLSQCKEMLKSGDKRILSGGTDFMVLVAEGSFKPTKVVNISEIEDIKKITIEGDYIKIGASVTFAQLLEFKSFTKAHNALLEAAIKTGGPQIRNAATIGGNICTASPAGDIITPLLVLGAVIQIESAAGVRKVELCDFFVGPKKSILKSDEVVSFIFVPLKDGGRSTFYKVGKRNSLIISTANMAIYMKYDSVITDIAIAVGSAAPTPRRTFKTEEFLKGKEITKETIEKAKEILDGEICPITDLRATETYRRKVCANMLEDSIKKLLKGVE